MKLILKKKNWMESHVPSWPQTHYVAKNGLDLMLLPPLLSVLVTGMCHIPGCELDLEYISEIGSPF